MGEASAESQKRFEDRLARARAGSRTAFEQLILPFRVALQQHARERRERRLQSKISDSDLFQITTLKAFENLSQFRGNTLEEFGCWLLGIMDHTASSQSRMYHRPTRDVAREVALDKIKERLVTNQAAREGKEEFGLLSAALTRLPDPFRKILHWRYYENKSYKEIGDLIGLSPDAAKHACYRAKRKLVEEAHTQEKG